MSNLDVHEALFKCSAYFLGRRAPADCTVFMEAVQKPLVEMYAEGSNTGRDIDMPREGHLLVLSSGIMFISINPLDKNIWLRMEDFRGGFALTFINDYENMRFYALDSPEAKQSNVAPIYALIMSRNKGVILNDCYGFSLASQENAKHIQNAVEIAASDKSGWSGCNIPPKINQTNLDKVSFKEEIIQEDDDGPIDRFKKPDLGNYFYAPSTNVIKSYSIKDDLPEKLVCFPEVKQKSLTEFLSISTPAPPIPTPTPTNLAQISANPVPIPSSKNDQPNILSDPRHFNYEAYRIVPKDQSTQLVPNNSPYVPAYNTAINPVAGDYLLLDETSGKPIMIDDPDNFDYAAYGIDPRDPTIQMIPAAQFQEEAQGAY